MMVLMEDDDLLPCEGKLAFDSKKDALAAASVAEFRYGSKLKVYVCRYCGLWHLATKIKTD